MCELVPSLGRRPDYSGGIGIDEGGTTVTPDSIAYYLDRQSLDEIYWFNLAVQCLEPEGWQDLPYPAPDEQVLVPPSTELRLRPVLPLGVPGA